MISTLLEALKSAGISPQLDLGNFTVGAATIMVALVSLFVALRSTRASNNQKIAEFRQRWIDGLRANLAQFVGTIYEILNHSISSDVTDDRQRDLDTKHSELKRLESHVAMQLNSHEKDHRLLIQLVAQTRGRAAGFSLAHESSLAYQIDDLIDLITDFSKLIFKTEWDRVRDETHGRGRLNQAIRKFARKMKRRSREATIRNRVASFFQQHGISTQGAT